MYFQTFHFLLQMLYLFLKISIVLEYHTRVKKKVYKIPKSCKTLNIAVVVSVDIAALPSILSPLAPFKAVILSLLTIRTLSVLGISYTIFVFPSIITSPKLRPHIINHIVKKLYVVFLKMKFEKIIMTYIYREFGVGPF